MATQWSAGGGSQGGADWEGAGKGKGKGQVPRFKRGSRSLVISPNLDALLEYDEQQTRVGEVPVEVAFSGPGLPPPPRRSRRVRSPRSPEPPGSPWGASSGRTSPWPASPSTPNPYINPAPSVGTLGAKAEVPEGAGEGEGPADGGETGQVEGGGWGRGPVEGGREGVFGVDVSNSPERGVVGQPTHAKRRLHLLKKMEFGVDIRRAAGPPAAGNPGMDMDTNGDTTVDRTLDRSSAAPRLGTRPLLSHGSWRRGSSSSSSSSSSGSSESSQGPASTIEARISISSTIYPASSAHSHPYHMYDHHDHDYDRSPVAAPRRASSQFAEQSPASSLSSFAADRTSFASFIDIAASPPSDQAVFSSPIIPVTIPDSLLHIFPHSHSQPVTRSPSPAPKPPVPTTPKPQFPRKPHPSLPPTTNFLHLDERSDLIRKNRKLARVFGQNPGPHQELPRHHRAAASVSSPLDLALAAPNTGRRHSAPYTPDDPHFRTPAELYVLNHAKSSPSSPTSFIDLSDDPALATPKKSMHYPTSPSSLSLFENMGPEEQEEEERRRKREKLAKLHRFLGSRVPAGLVLGLPDPEVNLPPALDVDTEPEERRAWLRRRRSSSAAAFSSTWSDELDRVKEELNDKEKAINVRRAQKMEKVFGVAPPQTLYHTRRSPSPSKSKPARRAVSPPNPNRSAYTKTPKLHRPGTSESSKHLLPKRSRSPSASPSPSAPRRTSAVYSHYQHSLNSLNDILDRDDRASLAELHQYLVSGDTPPALTPTPLQEFTRTPRRLSAASSLKSERRRSLPARTSVASLASLASELTLSTPRPEVTDFQARRRRAAKLTQFFGVDYRELISDVLESIENGLELERRRGTLRTEEVEDLLARLRGLRTKRGGLF